ncbi:hypothetical protein H6P81_005146 [Aristolochia fimbriata]|uniref:Uncharacterized protein n=1 Tax=Aristolochia fimbriata TaxID=158543 RepID=A0AAV7ETR4_ARIFI|nr:hypothetical protein H6P81_005146 [Aristolochia fimbriata]
MATANEFKGGFEVEVNGNELRNMRSKGIKDDEYTQDGTVDRRGRPALKSKTGGWESGILLLVNQGLATLAFFGVGVNLVLFLTRVVGQDNAEAANNVSKWTGTVYIFSLVGAFLSDSYWGRYKTCAIFQAIFVIGLVFLSLSSYIFLVKPAGCGNRFTRCGDHSSLEIGVFYVSIYLIALGNGGYQPSIATFGADQFDEEDPREGRSKVAFFSFFYLALNLGSLFSNTVLDYFEDGGRWALGFWASAGSALLALLLFLCGTPRYRHFKPGGNPLPRLAQVLVSAARKWRVELPSNSRNLFEVDSNECEDVTKGRKMLHTKGFKFLDRAAVVTVKDRVEEDGTQDKWRLCTVTQVEELKCILRLLPIWLCTIIYSVVFAQMASLFVEQGAIMKTTISNFNIPPASMSSFDILSVATFILFYRRLLNPIVSRVRKTGLTELERMGVGLLIAIMAMVAAGVVEIYRLRYVTNECANCESPSSLSILWQIPQYVFIGASEVFMYVGQLEFFNGQAPDGLKSFGSALCMTSISLGNYVSSLLVSAVMEITTKDHRPGWIPGNLNKGHMDRFYFLLAALTTIDFIIYLACSKWYQCIKLQGKCEASDDDEEGMNQGLATLAFFGVGVNLVLFMTKVLEQDNAEAANNVSKWTGTTYIFSLVGAFVSDSYWGRYRTCVIFQVIFVLGLVLLSLSSFLFLFRPCIPGEGNPRCQPPTPIEIGVFYVCIYQIALGNGGYQPSITTFGADQFDEEDPKEGLSKVAFFSYFYLAMNLGSLFSNTALVYIEDEGKWVLGFWASAGAAFAALALFLSGIPRYRHFKPCGNPLTRICQVIIAATKKRRVKVPPQEEDLYEVDGNEDSPSKHRKILHTQQFRYLDKAAVISTVDFSQEGQLLPPNPWRLCTITQVEEVKCILRLLPIWLCTIIYSVVYTQMASVFVEQGSAMNTAMSRFHIPPASMSIFEILGVATFVLICKTIPISVFCGPRRRNRKSSSIQLQSMGIGLIVAAIAMMSAGIVEFERLKLAEGCTSCQDSSSLSILWQIPQYLLVGASEVFMYVGQLEFFNGQAPDGLKSFGSALCMTSMSLGNYVSSLLMAIVMNITTRNNQPGWIAENLNKGHMDRFYFLLAALTIIDFFIFVLCAKWYRSISLEEKTKLKQVNLN